MKIPKLDYYILTLLKRNILYILSLLFFIFLLVIVLPDRISAYKARQEDIVVLKKDIVNLVRQKALITKYSPEELDTLVQLMNTVLPEKYDVFSIFAAIDDLERNSQLKFVSYSSPLAGLGTEGVLMNIEAQGSHETILNFLENYKTIGGRLIEIDKVSVRPASSTVTFSVLFHAVPQSGSTVVKDINPKTLQAIQNIQNRISMSQNSEELVKVTIIPKANPFQ